MRPIRMRAVRVNTRASGFPQAWAALSGLRLDPSMRLAIVVAMDEQGSPHVPGRSPSRWQEALGRGTRLQGNVASAPAFGCGS